MALIKSVLCVGLFILFIAVGAASTIAFGCAAVAAAICRR